jgi:hypothetical protein
MSDAEVMIHVRFAPDGTVTEISERPAEAAPQRWFNFLTEKVGTTFQPLSGGRGVFRVARAAVDEMRAALPGA